MESTNHGIPPPGEPTGARPLSACRYSEMVEDRPNQGMDIPAPETSAQKGIPAFTTFSPISIRDAGESLSSRARVPTLNSSKLKLLMPLGAGNTRRRGHRTQERQGLQVRSRSTPVELGVSSRQGRPFSQNGGALCPGASCVVDGRTTGQLLHMSFYSSHRHPMGMNQPAAPQPRATAGTKSGLLVGSSGTAAAAAAAAVAAAAAGSMPQRATPQPRLTGSKRLMICSPSPFPVILSGSNSPARSDGAVTGSPARLVPNMKSVTVLTPAEGGVRLRLTPPPSPPLHPGTAEPEDKEKPVVVVVTPPRDAQERKHACSLASSIDKNPNDTEADMANGDSEELDDDGEDEEEETEEIEETDEDVEGMSWAAAMLRVAPLATPATVSMALTFALSVVPLAMVGSALGEQALAGCSVGYFIISILAQYPVCGLSFAMDALCSQEYGRDPCSSMQGIYLQRGAIVNVVCLIPICGILYVIGYWGLPLAYAAEVADTALAFLYYCPLFLIPLVLFMTFLKFCSNQMLPQLPMIAMVVGVVCTPIAQKMLLPSMGVQGAMLGMAVTWVQLAVICTLTMASPTTRRTIGAFRLQQALTREGLREYLALALPSALFVAAEASAFDVTVLLAAGIGSAEGAAWSAIMSVLFICVSIAGGVSGGACARIGAALGAYQPRNARTYTLASVASIAVISIGTSVLIILFFDQLIGLFGTAGQASLAAHKVLWLVPIIHMGDAIQFTFQGVFSGMGKNKIGAKILLSALWLFGFPLELFFSKVLNMGLTGVLLGLACGLWAEVPAMVWYALRADWDVLCKGAQSNDDREDSHTTMIFVDDEELEVETTRLADRLQEELPV